MVAPAADSNKQRNNKTRELGALLAQDMLITVYLVMAQQYTVSSCVCVLSLLNSILFLCCLQQETLQTTTGIVYVQQSFPVPTALFPVPVPQICPPVSVDPPLSGLCFSYHAEKGGKNVCECVQAPCPGTCSVSHLRRS